MDSSFLRKCKSFCKTKTQCASTHHSCKNIHVDLHLICCQYFPTCHVWSQSLTWTNIWVHTIPSASTLQSGSETTNTTKTNVEEFFLNAFPNTDEPTHVPCILTQGLAVTSVRWVQMDLMLLSLSIKVFKFEFTKFYQDERGGEEMWTRHHKNQQPNTVTSFASLLKIPPWWREENECKAHKHN